MLDNHDVALINTWREIGDMWHERANHIYKCCQQAVDDGSIKGLEDMVAYSFNAGAHNPSFGGGGGDSMPIGQWPVIIVASVLAPTKDNTGGMLKLTCKGIDGAAKDTTKTINLNLKNNSNQAVQIANEQLAAICCVIGKPGLQMQATEELHDLPFVIDVIKQPNNDKYTEVTAIYTMNGQTAADVLTGSNNGNNNGGGQQTQQQQQQNTGGGANFGGGQPQTGGQGGGFGGGQQTQPNNGGGFGGGQPQTGGAGNWGGGAANNQGNNQQPNWGAKS